MATQRSLIAAEANNIFGLQLYKSLQSRLGAKENIFLSPLSISVALTMTYMGAKGETAKQVESVMKLSLLGKDVHLAFKDLNSDLLAAHPPNLFQLKLANRLYGHKGFRFLPEYLTSTQDLYGAKLEAVDFINETEATREAINAWVEEQTAGKINNLIAPGGLSSDARLVLVSAIYFKGEWVKQFNKRNTKDLPFYLTSSQKVTVPMMYQTKMFGFYHDKTLNCKVLVMGYKGGKINMMIALPDYTNGLEKLESSLSQDVLHSWSSKLKSKEVRVTIPKFKFTKSFSLVEYLKRMGMADLFQAGKADLSGISKDELVVSEVIHKAFLEVNEEGSEAAAATAVMMPLARSIVMHSEEPELFTANHPFVFFIRDQISGAVLFMGRVMQPVIE